MCKKSCFYLFIIYQKKGITDNEDKRNLVLFVFFSHLSTFHSYGESCVPKISIASDRAQSLVLKYQSLRKLNR